MVSNLVLPVGGNSSTKELVVQILSQEWPLTAKQIYNRILKERSSAISYQAVHKTVVEMVSDGVLERNEKGYCLSESWIKDLKKSASFLEGRYSKQKAYDFTELLRKDCAVYDFNGILELARFLVGVLLKLPNPENKPTVSLWMFVYSIIGINDADYAELKEIFAKTPNYVFCYSNTFLDGMFAKTLKEYGVKEVFLSVKSSSALQDTVVQGDYVAYITYDPDYRLQWLSESVNSKSLETFDLGKHFETMRDEKTPITVVVAKNAGLADRIREAYLGKKSREFMKL